MARRSRYPGNKGNQQSSSRRKRNGSSVGKRPAVQSPVSVASKEISPSRGIPDASIASEPIESTLPPPPYLIRELKLTLMIAGVMLIILVVLSIIL